MDMIKRLKENEKPFGLMDAEMQAKAEEIGPRSFQEYMGVHLLAHVWNKYCTVFAEKRTYRLNPDYQAEDGYELCEVVDDGIFLGFTSPNNIQHRIDQAPSLRDFAGYKYEDGHMSGCAVLYKGSDGNIWDGLLKEWDIKDYEVLRPTNIVFKT